MAANEITTRLSSSQKRNAQLGVKVTDLESQLSGLQGLNQTLLTENETLQSSMDDLGAQVVGLESDLRSTNDILSLHQNELRRQVRLKLDANANAQNLEAQLSSVADAATNMATGENDAQISTLQADFDTVQARNTGLQVILDATEAGLERETDLRELSEAQVMTLQTELTGLNEQVVELQTDLTQANSTIEGLNNSASDASMSMQTEIDTAQALSKSLQVELDTTKGQLEQEIDLREAAEAQIVGLQTEITGLNDQIVSLAAPSLSDVQARANTLTLEYRQLLNQYSQLGSLSTEQQAELDAAQAALEEVQLEVARQEGHKGVYVVQDGDSLS